MMEKRALVKILFILLFVVSCRGTQDPVNFDEEIYVGSEALRMNFINEVPPSVVYTSSGERFPLAVNLENKGTYPLKGTLFFSGYDPSIMSLPTNGIAFPTYGCTFPEILPKTRGNPNGGICVAEFEPILDLSTVQDAYDTTILATAMFWYGTNADVNFCVDPIPNRFKTAPQSCIMQPVSVSGGQGAPVGVTSVEANAVGRGKVLYRIVVQNLGTGTVVNPLIPPSRLRPTDTNEVGFRIAIPGGNSFGGNFVNGDSTTRFNVGQDGSGSIYFRSSDFFFSQFFRPRDSYSSNTVRLNNGRGIITQMVDYGNIESAFQTPLQIILSYGYMQSTQIPVRIVNVDSYEPDSVGGRIVVNTNNGRIQVDNGVSYVNNNGGIDISRLR